MKTRISLISVSLAAFIIAGAFVNAARAAELPFHPILLNEASLREISNQEGLSLDMNVFAPSICTVQRTTIDPNNDGCLYVGFTDSSEYVSEAAFALSRRNEAQLSGDTVTLSSIPERLSASAGTLKAHDKLYDNYYKLLDKQKLFSPRKRIAIEKLSLQAAYGKFKTKEMDLAAFRKTVFSLPDAFTLLPAFYQEISQSGDSALIDGLQQILQEALLKTLFALQAIRAQDTLYYPFEGLANVKPGPLVSYDILYSNLNSIGRWPKFVDLNSQVRNQVGGAYLKKTSFGSWQVLATYNDDSNEIWIDFTQPFFENVFTLSHELFHVAWNHSGYAKKQESQILQALQKAQNGGDISDLRKSLLRSISQNEYLAINNQIWLYHGAGGYVDQWAPGQDPSARGWHDLYFGKKIYKDQISSAWVHFNAEQHDSQIPVWKALLMVTPPGIVAFTVKMMTDEVHGVVNSYQSTDPAYEDQRHVTHTRVFENLYLATDLSDGDGSTFSSDVASEGLFENLAVPSPVALSCADLAKIKEALGSNWEFGVPFPYSLSDPENCKGGGPIHPGVEGTHGEKSGSDLPAGFPSMFAPDNRE